MNISQQLGVSPSQGAGRIHAATPAAVSPHAAETPALDLPKGNEAPPSGRHGSEVIERLDAAAAKLHEKLSGMVDGQRLSSEQVAELREAEGHFQATLERIHNALDGRGLAPTTLRHGYRTAISEMRSAVNDILRADDPQPETEGTAVSGPRMVNLNSQPGVSSQAERIGDVGEEPMDEVPTEEDPTLRRISFAENRMGERIEEMLQSEDLTEAQRTALLETRDTFQATLDRLRNAMEGDIAPTTIRHGFGVAMSEMRRGMREAMAADGPAVDSMGAGEGAGEAAPIVDPRVSRRLEQMHAAADDIGARLENLMSREGLGEHQIAALEGARDDFRASLDTLRKSLMESEMGVGDVRQAFMQALDGLVSDVHAALRDSTPAAVYTPGLGVDHLGANESGSEVDRTA